MLTKDRQDRQEKGMSVKARINILTLNNALAENRNML